MKGADLPLETVKEILDYFPICGECGGRVYHGELEEVSLDFTFKSHNFSEDELDEMFDLGFYDQDLDQMYIYDMKDKRVSICMIHYMLNENNGRRVDIKEMYIDMDEVGVCGECVKELYKVFFIHVYTMYMMKKGVFKWMIFTDFEKSVEGKVSDNWDDMELWKKMFEGVEVNWN